MAVHFSHKNSKRNRFYNRYNRNYVFDIDFWYLRQVAEQKGKKYRGIQYAVDAMHAGCFTRFFNHSCDPNAVIVPCIFGDADDETPYLAFFTHRDISEDEEITFSYKGEVPVNDPETIRAAKAKKARTKPQAKTSKKENDHIVNVACACGAWNCNGSIWNWDDDDDDDDDDESQGGSSSPDELAGED